MAGRGARSDRGNVRGALVDEFTHVITGGTTRNCVLKQSSTLLRRCSAQCRRREAGRHSGCGRGTGCLFGTNAAREPQARTVQRTAPELVLRPRERPDSLSARSPCSAGSSLSGRTVTYGDSRQSQPSRDIRLVRRGPRLVHHDRERHAERVNLRGLGRVMVSWLWLVGRVDTGSGAAALLLLGTAQGDTNSAALGGALEVGWPGGISLVIVSPGLPRNGT